MIFGADNQNKNLRIASRIKANPTAKTRTANHYSAAVSTSKTKSNSQSIDGQRTTVHQSRKNLNDGRPDPVRGSLEGLDNSKSAYLQASNAGYDNRALQAARYSSKEKNIQTQMGASFLFTNKQKSGIINNYTNLTLNNSSSDRMNKGLNINRYF